MGIRKKMSNHRYLLSLYSRVNQALETGRIEDDRFGDIVVSFCIVSEKVLKLALHKKNPLLVFDSSKMKEDDVISCIAIRKDVDIDTIRAGSTIRRYCLIFKNKFSEAEISVLEDIFKTRNNLVHGYKDDIEIGYLKDDLLKKMGSVWEKISTQAVKLFGQDIIRESKPAQLYTEKQLEKILTQEVEKKIGKPESFLKYPGVSIPSLEDRFVFDSEKCPRCESSSFTDKKSDDNSLLYLDLYNFRNPNHREPSFYYCNRCNLELTEKEYEIAKKIRRNEKL